MQQLDFKLFIYKFWLRVMVQSTNTEIMLVYEGPFNGSQPFGNCNIYFHFQILELMDRLVNMVVGLP